MEKVVTSPFSEFIILHIEYFTWCDWWLSPLNVVIIVTSRVLAAFVSNLYLALVVMFIIMNLILIF